MRKAIVIVIALLAIGLALFAEKVNKEMGKTECENCDQPQMMKPNPGKGFDPEFREMWKELELTEAQTKKMDQLRDNFQKTMNTNRAKLQNLEIDKQNALVAEDWAKVKQFNKSISDLELENANLQVDHHQAVLKELTAEQKTKFMEIRKKGMMMGPQHQKMKEQHHKGK